MTKLNNPEISDYKIGETALPKSFYLNVNTIGFFCPWVQNHILNTCTTIMGAY